MLYRRFITPILMLSLLFLLTSCLEVKQGININKDGSGDARLEIAIQQMWAPQVVPKLKSDIPKGWSVIEEKEKDGKHVIVLGRKFKDISELNDDENRYTFSSERKGFLKKSYVIEVKQLKSSDMPFPYEVTIKMPGSIDETDGIKIASGEVKWNLQGLRKGTELSVKSSALAMPDFASLKESFSSLKESFNKVFTSVFYREAIVYNILPDGVDQSKFIYAIESMGYEVRSKRPRPLPDGSFKADWDLQIAVDAIALADKVDVMVILTGDTDFVPLVYALKSKGVKVEIMSFPETTGHELIEAADVYIEITDDILIYDQRHVYRD